MVPQRRIERWLPPYQCGALPLGDCGPLFLWCWLEDSNPPPLAYKASALPDELSQPGKLKKERGAAPRAEASVLERAGNPTPRPILDVHNVKERGATGTVVMRKRSPGQEHAHTRGRPRHTDGFWMFCGS
jgi:hypothetical protein